VESRAWRQLETEAQEAVTQRLAGLIYEHQEPFLERAVALKQFEVEAIHSGGLDLADARLLRLLEQNDRLSVAVADPDHPDETALAHFGWAVSGGQSGWQYMGQTPSEHYRIADGKVPANLFVRPGSMVLNLTNGTPEFEPRLRYGSPLAYNIGDGERDLPMRTAELTEPDYYGYTSYQYDEGSITAVSLLVPVPEIPDLQLFIERL
jgi:hypothetical protein